jgi:hypothetical protein
VQQVIWRRHGECCHEPWAEERAVRAPVLRRGSKRGKRIQQILYKKVRKQRRVAHSGGYGRAGLFLDTPKSRLILIWSSNFLRHHGQTHNPPTQLDAQAQESQVYPSRHGDGATEIQRKPPQNKRVFIQCYFKQLSSTFSQPRQRKASPGLVALCRSNTPRSSVRHISSSILSHLIVVRSGFKSRSYHRGGLRVSGEAGFSPAETDVKKKTPKHFGAA